MPSCHRVCSAGGKENRSQKPAIFSTRLSRTESVRKILNLTHRQSESSHRTSRCPGDLRRRLPGKAAPPAAPDRPSSSADSQSAARGKQLDDSMQEILAVVDV